MKIEIKQALLEGHTPEVIVEAVHANHPRLNKRLLKDPTTSYADGKAIENERKKLFNSIKGDRSYRDRKRKVDTTNVKSPLHNPTELKMLNDRDANNADNAARAKSQTGGSSSGKELDHFDYKKTFRIMSNVPRVISSAKQ